MSYQKRSAVSLFLRGQGWVCLLFILAGVGLGYSSTNGLDTVSQLSSSGIETTGEVTNKTESHRKGSSRSYSVSYSFPTTGDPYTRGMQAVTREYYDSIAEGDQVPVRYLPSDPTVSETEFGSPVSHQQLALFIAAALILIGLGYGVFLFRRARCSIWLRERGELRQAEVNGHDIENKDSDKAKRARALWRDASGKEGRSLLCALSELPPVGATITVFADPEGKMQGVWEGDVGSR